MRTVFADSGYWIALSNPHDELHERAKTASQSRIPRIVTSQMVLVEFLTSMGGRRQHLRRRAVEVVSGLAEDPNVEVVPQTDVQFESAVAMYSSRLDKEWSLTDCASFVLMEQMNIREALAHDHNFEQAGFIALLRQI